eukprot:3634408-Amphidinium_carterae.1
MRMRLPILETLCTINGENLLGLTGMENIAISSLFNGVCVCCVWRKTKSCETTMSLVGSNHRCAAPSATL